MIKKYFKYLFSFVILGIGLVNYTFGYARNSYEYPLNTPVEINDGLSNVFELKDNFNFLSNGNVKVFQQKIGDFTFTYFWSDGGLYVILFYVDGSVLGQGFFKNYCKVDMSSNDWCWSSDISISNLVNSINFSNPINLWFKYDDTESVSLCFDYSNGDRYCFYFDRRYQGSLLTGSYGFSNGLYYASDINNSVVGPYIDYSPFGNFGGLDGTGSDSDLGDGGIELQSDESAINYFENRYGRDESICYAGIDNITDLWGSSVSFNQGSGLNIFQVFSGLYGNSDLDKVYVWLNSRLINYGQWFGREGDPLYLSTYNSGENKVDLYYTGFSFPFANNPVAIYFLVSNIYDNSEFASMGSEVVSYCNLKIQEGSFDEIIDQSTKNNITNYTEQSNKNNGLNPDGTEKNGYNYFTGSTDYTGSIGSRTGMTWQDIEYSGDVDMKSIFQKGLDEMKSALDNFHNPFTGVLPQYIISALLFVCLFKLLRR